jgi:hypothetical protein
MKTTLCVVLLLASAITLTAAEIRKVGEKEPIPETGFADATALEKWSGTSSFGGGHSSRLPLPGREIYWTTRMVTSGRPSCELVLWKRRNDRLVPCLIMPVRYGAYLAFVEGEDVVVKGEGLRPQEPREVIRLKSEFFAEP